MAYSIPSPRELHHFLNRLDFVDHLQEVLLLSLGGLLHVTDIQPVLIPQQN